MFLAAQIIGLFIIGKNVDVTASKQASEEAGTKITVYQNLPLGLDRPEISPGSSYIFIGVAVLIGTLLMLGLIRFHVVSLWKIWLFGAIVLCLTVALSSFIPSKAAAAVAVAAAFFKVIKPNLLVHNLTEVFLYGGLAVVFVPVMNVKSAAILLILLALYDVFAVFLSKHMVTLAKFQASNQIFAGFFVPKKLSGKMVVSEMKTSQPATKGSTAGYSDSGEYAVVGGGDIGFPLFFAGAAMAVFGPKAFIIPFFATFALAFLMVIGKKDKFYPAMPFVAAGCFIGYATLLWL